MIGKKDANKENENVNKTKQMKMEQANTATKLKMRLNYYSKDQHWTMSSGGNSEM